MRFAKYQGTGNDFVLVADPDDALALSPEVVRRLCDRRFGIGADGVIRVGPGRDGGALFMDYVNSDGSLGEMCGNGIRCLAVFARAKGLVSGGDIPIATRSGLRTVTLRDDGDVTVDMGAPRFSPPEIPVIWDGSEALHAKIDLGSEIVEATCLSMGNPHAVLFVDDPVPGMVTTLGPLLEQHPLFPRKTNVEFTHVVSPQRLVMRVWERGSGETMACGTGACAAVVAARVVAGGAPDVIVELPGGRLRVSWNGSLDHEAPVFLTGPAVLSFEGDVELEPPL